MLSISVNYPKKAPVALLKKAKKAIKKISEGEANFRKTNAFGYLSMDLGDGKRLVMLSPSSRIAHVFNGHREYEKFISRPH